MQNLSDCIAVSRKILMLHSTLLHTLQIFAIFVYFALVPSYALGASTSRAATLFNFYMVSCCSIWSPIFKTVFVFDVRPFLLLSINFFGFNGNFNGKMTKINKMAKNHFSGVQNGPQSVEMGVLGGYLY